MVGKLAKGIELLAETTGQGLRSEKGCRIVYSARIFLRRGDEVTPDAKTIAAARGSVTTANCDGAELIRHQTILGRRRPIAGIEKSLDGMQAGGYREVLISPHLGYGSTGVPGTVPPDALLRVRLWVHEVHPPFEKDC